MYDVVDEIYDKYLERTSKTRPPEGQTEEEYLTIEKPVNHNYRKEMRFKLQEEAKCVNRLEIKNRKRMKELNEILKINNRKKALQKKDFESYRPQKRAFGT